MFGDFNEIAGPSEKEGGASRGGDRWMHLGRLWQRGTSTTTVVRERLDRFLANEGWYNLFPNAAIIHLARYRSDHAPLLLKSDYVRGRQNDDRLFKFESYWLSKDECRDVVAASWHEHVSGSMSARI